MKNFIQKIFGINWSIEYVAHSPELKVESEEDPTGWEYDHGVTMPNENRIVINRNLPIDRQEFTLLHEHIHIIEFENLLDLDHSAVKCLTAGLYALGYRLPADALEREE